MRLAFSNPEKSSHKRLQTPWNAFPGNVQKVKKNQYLVTKIGFLTKFFQPFHIICKAFHKLYQSTSIIIKNVQNSWILSLFVMRQTDRNLEIRLRRVRFDTYSPNFGYRWKPIHFSSLKTVLWCIFQSNWVSFWPWIRVFCVIDKGWSIPDFSPREATKYTAQYCFGRHQFMVEWYLLFISISLWSTIT